MRGWNEQSRKRETAEPGYGYKVTQMEVRQKVGEGAMVVATVLFLSSLLMSSNWGYSQYSFMARICNVLMINLILTSDVGAPEEYLINLRTSYALVFCIALFGWGVLVRRGIVGLPNFQWTISQMAPGTMKRPNENEDTGAR